MLALYLTQRNRLKAYDECYMAKMRDWNTDCVLTEPIMECGYCKSENDCEYKYLTQSACAKWQAKKAGY